MPRAARFDEDEDDELEDFDEDDSDEDIDEDDVDDEAEDFYQEFR